jgi:Domain of unknown function (DUF4307)
VSDPTEIPGDSLAERYGDRRPGRRPVVVALAVLLIGALLAWGVWAAWLNADRALDADLSAYEVVDAHQVRVKVTPHIRDAEVDGSCLVRATASDHTIVGEVNLTADELRAARGTWIPIRTERRATTATVVRCSE